MANRMTNKPEDIQRIIDQCEACYLGMIDPGNKPYVIPMNFAIEDGMIYLHAAREGKKIDVLKGNPNVCVAFSTDHQLFHRHEPVACSYGMKYRSVLAFGKVVFIEDYNEKERIMNVIMKKYTGREFTYNAPAINNICVFKVEVDRFEGKESGY